MAWLDFSSKLKGGGRRKGAPIKPNGAAERQRSPTSDEPEFDPTQAPSFDSPHTEVHAPEDAPVARDPRTALAAFSSLEPDDSPNEFVNAAPPRDTADAQGQATAMESSMGEAFNDWSTSDESDDQDEEDEEDEGYEDLPEHHSTQKRGVAQDRPNNHVRLILVAVVVGVSVLVAAVYYSADEPVQKTRRVTNTKETIDGSVPSIPGVTEPYKGLLIGGGADGGMASSLNESLNSQPRVSAPISSVQLEEILSASANSPNSTSAAGVSPPQTTGLNSTTNTQTQAPGSVAPTMVTTPNGTFGPTDLKPIVLPGNALPAPLSGVQATPVAEANTLDPDSRKRSSKILIGENGSGMSTASLSPAAKSGLSSGDPSPLQSSQDKFAERMQATRFSGVSASIIPSMTFMISQGTSIACVLEMAISSAQPGLTTCRIPQDIYSDTGKVLLIEKGSRVTGEYRDGVGGGDARVFIVWSRIKTPGGVIIDLNSPAGDELGRTGVPGEVETYFFKRFGGAILVSLIQDVVAAVINKQAGTTTSGSTTTQTSTISSGEEIVRNMLSDSLAVRPVLFKNQGDMVQIIVARDLDFSKVYALKRKRSELETQSVQ